MGCNDYDKNIYQECNMTGHIITAHESDTLKECFRQSTLFLDETSRTECLRLTCALFSEAKYEVN